MQPADGYRLLMVTPWLPFPPVSGFRTRAFELIRALSGRHQVTLLTYARPEEAEAIAELRQMAVVHVVERSRPSTGQKRRAQLRSLAGRRSYQTGRLRSVAMQRAIDAALAAGDMDLVQIESSMLGCFRFPAGTPLVLDAHNIEHEIFGRAAREEHAIARRLFSLSEFLKLRGEERQVWRRAAGIAVTSERERQVLAAALPGKPIVTVANAVDVQAFSPLPGVGRDPNQIVFTGLMSYRPNVDAAAFFARAVLPLIHRQRPEARFTVVGANPPAEVLRLAGSRVQVTGRVDDVRPYLAAAGAVVVPLRFGSGTRLKVLEGLAMAAPMVSTPLGCEGIALRTEEHLLVEGDPARFAEAVLRLLNRPEDAAALGRRGRALVEACYTWSAVVTELEQLYSRLIGAGRPTVPV